MHPKSKSPLYVHAADALCRARKLPIGPSRNDLRQLAIGLRWLERKGYGSKVETAFDRSPRANQE
jgi:hypothetical protein